MPPPPEDTGVTISELSRQVRDVFIRFQGISEKLEIQFLRKDIFELYKENVRSAESLISKALKDLEDNKVSKEEHIAALARISNLEDTNKWLSRLLIGFIVLAILGTVFATGGVKT